MFRHGLESAVHGGVKCALYYGDVRALLGTIVFSPDT